MNKDDIENELISILRKYMGLGCAVEVSEEIDKLYENNKMKFELTDSQLEKIYQWDDPKTGHKCNVNKQGDVTGARLEYIFIPTGLGDVVRVKCECGAILDVTEDFG